MSSSAPSIPTLGRLFAQGSARVLETWQIIGPANAGLWWRLGQDVVGAPRLLRLAEDVPADGERVGLLLALDPRFREPWLNVIAARLRELGLRGREEELCRQITALGAASVSLRDRVTTAAVKPSDHAALELALWGAPADQPAAAPALLRVLGQTASLVEGGQATPATPLPEVHRRDPGVNWVAGRLIQMPGTSGPSRAVLAGRVKPCAAPTDGPTRMAWVLETPWVNLLAVLAFTAEAWAAERQGGLQLELSDRMLEHFASPPRVDVAVTLKDGQEVLCGSLGELCLRVLDALGMAIVPFIDAAALDQRLGPVIGELLRAGVWRFEAEGRSRYQIGTTFGFDCYRGEGHQHIFLGAERLSQTIRSAAVAWAKSRVEQAEREVRA
jgi:hypothetical protein